MNEISLSQPDPIIRLDNIHLIIPATSGPVNILRGISLTIGQGETIALLGPSGSGKTSLLMLLAGLERATSGVIKIAGADLGGMDEDARAKFRLDHLGIVFQSFYLIPSMTALQNVAVPLELAGAKGADEIAARALTRVGLAHRLTHLPAQLSGGEQQRVAIARAVAPGPKLLLADEPTGNLDVETGGAVMDLLFELCAARNTTLLLITHDQALAARCGRTIRLTNGTLAA
jgi:putative ABC transport system ATP-binding protein